VALEMQSTRAVTSDDRHHPASAQIILIWSDTTACGMAGRWKVIAGSPQQLWV